MTQQKRNLVFGVALGVFATAMIVVVVGGCSMFKGEATVTEKTDEADQQAEASPAVPATPSEPTLLAAGDAHLTLFGEFPDHNRVPFQARAASPMQQHTFNSEGADFDVDVSPDARWVVFSSTRHSVHPDLYLKTVDGRAVTQLASDPGADVQPCFSPDGHSIVFASNRTGNWDLWMVGLNGGPARQLTRSSAHEVHPSFAPDGKRLVYCMFNERSQQWELWTLNLDQPGSRQMIGVGLFPEWSPVSDSIVYQRARERGGRWFSIWRVDLENGEPKFPIELASSSDMAFIQPSWSADGQWVAYGTATLGSGDSGPLDASVPVLNHGDVWIMRSDGTSPLKLTDGQGAHFSPTFSPDQHVFFTSLQNGVENVWSVKPLLVPINATPTASAGPVEPQQATKVAVPVVPEQNQGG